MAQSETHYFKVWHPNELVTGANIPVYTLKKFDFRQPVSRQGARRSLEKEGYVIQRSLPIKERTIKQPKQKVNKQKVTCTQP